MTSTPHIASSMCDQALDYAYDELSGDAKVEFEKHLPTCARCQAEVEAFARVRGAVRAVMPLVEPPVATASMGSLHAQLMHAAAQRRPAGKVLSFGGRVKKVVLHPAFAMAASFVFVAGAVSLMYSHKQLVTPVATAPASSAAPSPVTVPTAPVVAAAPAADAPAATGNAMPAKQAEAVAKVGDKSGAPMFKDAPAKPMTTRLDHAYAPKPMSKGKSDSLYLELDNGKKLTVNEEKSKGAPPKAANIDGLGGGSSLSRVQGGDGLTSEQKPTGPGQGTWNGQVRNFNNAAEQRQKSEGTIGSGYARNQNAAPATQAPGAAPEAQPTMPPPATAPSAPADAQSPSTSSGKRGYTQGRLALDENVDGLRRKADELAKGGRCDDAEKLYRQLEKTSAFHITVAERLNMVHCKTQVGQFQKAQDDIETLKVQRRDSPAIEREQDFLDRTRARKTPVMQSQDVAAPAPTEAPVRTVTPTAAPSPSKKSKKADSQADKAAY